MNNIKIDIDNCILNIFSSDKIDNILSNLNLNNYYEVKQIHSDIVNIVDENYINNSIGDAMITNIPNKPLIIKVADCVPLLLYDKENKVISLVHSGWKGTLENITTKTIKIMMDKFNSNPKNISAYIYPSIRKCHFEVEYDVYSLFKNKIENIDKYTTQKGIKYYIDLQQIIKDELNKLGITNIIDTFICTYCNHDIYHSYRYNHTDKRNILLVMIKE
ncbi:MAG: peptidoglycan editing factor PgeF [Bacilli bacterium]|nr:peptidoglycan editing factor PgeF [Bacilli bacterium]